MKTTIHAAGMVATANFLAPNASALKTLSGLGGLSTGALENTKPATRLPTP